MFYFKKHTFSSIIKDNTSILTSSKFSVFYYKIVLFIMNIFFPRHVSLHLQPFRAHKYTHIHFVHLNRIILCRRFCECLRALFIWVCRHLFYSFIEEEAFETSLRCNHVMCSLSCTIIRWPNQIPCLPPSVPPSLTPRNVSHLAPECPSQDLCLSLLWRLFPAFHQIFLFPR